MATDGCVHHVFDGGAGSARCKKCGWAPVQPTEASTTKKLPARKPRSPRLSPEELLAVMLHILTLPRRVVLDPGAALARKPRAPRATVSARELQLTLFPPAEPPRHRSPVRGRARKDECSHPADEHQWNFESEAYQCGLCGLVSDIPPSSLAPVLTEEPHPEEAASEVTPPSSDEHEPRFIRISPLSAEERAAVARHQAKMIYFGLDREAKAVHPERGEKAEIPPGHLFRIK